MQEKVIFTPGELVTLRNPLPAFQKELNEGKWVVAYCTDFANNLYTIQYNEFLTLNNFPGKDLCLSN